MSSLAAQLKRLSTPSTLSFRAAQSSKKPSLLFSESEAGDLDVETVYSLGVNGLAELQTINPVFQSFQNSLFGNASMSFERTQQTSGSNEMLDVEIWRFLLEVSPYVLLKPAQKALEWLIRTFWIHSYNTDALLACILPFHNTTLFVRVLQLIPLKDPTSRWHWLLPAQRSASPLSRLTVLQQCQSVPSFLQFICDLVERAIGDSETGRTVLVSFYTSICVSLLNNSPVVSEQLLIYLVPSCLKSLRCNHGELKAGGYMILGQLAVRAVLEAKVVESLVDGVCRHVEADLLLAAVGCLACVFQTQSAKFSKRSLRSLCRQPELVSSLVLLSQTHNISPLLNGLLPGVLRAALSKLSAQQPGSDSETGVHAGKAEYMAVICEAIHALPLPGELSARLAGSVIESYVKMRSGSKQDVSSDAVQGYNQLSQSLNLRYPSGVDQALATVLVSVDEAGDDTKLQHIHDFMEMTLCGTRNQVLLDRNTARVLTFNHPQAHVRCLAVKQAQRSLNEIMESNESLDAQFFASSFVERLSDEDPSVCKCVLDLNKILLKLVDRTTLYSALLKLIQRCRANSDEDMWCQLGGQAMVLLCRAISRDSLSLPSSTSALLSIVQHVWLTHRHQHFSAVLLKSLSSSSSKKSDSSVLSTVTMCATTCLASLKSSSGSTAFAAANSTLLNCVLDLVLSMSSSFNDVVLHLSEWCLEPAADSRQRHCLVALVICCWLRSKDSRRSGCSLACCQQLLKLISPLVDDVMKNEVQVTMKQSKELASATSVKSLDGVLAAQAESSGVGDAALHWWAAVQVVSWSVKSVTVSLEIPSGLAGADYWSETSCSDDEEKAYLQVIHQLLPMLLQLSATVPQAKPKRLVTQLVDKHFKSPSVLLKALSMVWTEDSYSCGNVSHNAEENEFSKPRLSLVKAAGVFQSAEDIKGLIGGSAPAIPSLLCGLCHKSSEVRQAAAEACQALVTACEANNTTSRDIPLLPVMEAMAQLSVQVSADAQVVPDTLAAKTAITGSSKVAKQWQAVMKYLVELSVSQATPLHIKVMLLTCLDNVPSKEWLPLTRDVALSSLRQMFSETRGKTSSPLEHECLRRLLHCQLQAANISNANHLAALETIETTLNECHAALEDAVSACDFVLPVITPALFLALPVAARRRLVCVFLDRICAPGTSREMAERDAAALHKCLMQFPLDGEDILHELRKPNSLLSAPEESSPRKGRSKRKKMSSDASSVPVSAWQRAVVLLELLQGNGDLTNMHILMPSLFRALSMSIEADGEGVESSEYTRQLILSAIHSLCRKTPSGKRSSAGMLKADDFNVECVVRCVRASSNPQTHHHALLLLASAATLFPDRVLHNVMAIFTFMGANLLRLDDSYSFEVIQRTIHTVIPALVQASSGASQAVMQQTMPIVLSVMRVFADAWPHMPIHRTDAIFQNLITTLGAEQFLHFMLELLVERYVMQPSVSSSTPCSSQPSSAVSSPTREGDYSLAVCDASFPSQLCGYFDVSVQLKSLHMLMEYIASLPVMKPESGGKPKAKKAPFELPLFDVAAHTERQLQLYKVQLLTTMADIISGDTFVIPDASPVSSTKDVHAEVLSLLEMVMTFANQQTRLSVKQADASIKSCLKSVYTTAFKIVTVLCEQLTADVLVDVVLKLSSHKTPAVQNKAMEILSAGLQKQDRRPWSADQEPIFLPVVDRLTKMLQLRLAAGVSSAKSGREELVTCQSALYCLKLLTCQLAARNPEPLLKVARVVLDVLEAEDCCPQVCASAVLCWGEAVASLGPQLIGDLPRATKVLLAVLKSSWTKDNPTLLQISIITALGKLIIHLPSFLGKQLKNIIRQLVHGQLCTDAEESSSKSGNKSGRSNLLLRAQAARMTLAVKVPARALFPAIHQCLQSVAKPSKVPSVLSLLGVFSRTVQETPKAELCDMADHFLIEFFIDLFSFIADHFDEFSQADLQELQERSTKCFMGLVMRCSEDRFRPMFNKLCRWADREGDVKERVLIFFQLMFSLAERLKGLFTLFGGPVVDMAVAVLESINRKKHGDSFFSGAANGISMDSDSDGDSDSDEDDSAMSDGEHHATVQHGSKSLVFPSDAWKCQRLATVCSDTLTQLFLHDAKNKLVHKQLFEEVMPPLVDQLESSRGSMGDYQSYMSNHLVPCMSQLAVAANSVPLWKQMNTLILGKTACSSVRVRFAALSVLKELFVRLSEEYVALLPETIPALAELLEDESPEVEKQCQSLMKVIEEITGESVQSYF